MTGSGFLFFPSILSAMTIFNVGINLVFDECINMSPGEQGVRELGMVLLLIVSLLLIHTVVGKVLALLLAMTRRDVLVLDCGAYEIEFENGVDDRVMSEEFILRMDLEKDVTITEKIHFEGLEGQSALQITGSVYR